MHYIFLYKINNLIKESNYYMYSNNIKDMNIFEFEEKSLESKQDKINNLLLISLNRIVMKKGKFNKSSKLINKCVLLVKKLVYINFLFFLKLIVIKSSNALYLKKYFLGRREKLVPKIISMNSNNLILFREIAKKMTAKVKKIDVLVDNVLNIFFNDKIEISNYRYINEQARIHKYEFLRNIKKRRRRRFRLFKR